MAIFLNKKLLLIAPLLLLVLFALPQKAHAALTDGLVGWWTFDGADITTNAILDKSGQGNNGGFIGGATSSAKVIGKLGQALNFNGSTYVGLGTPSSLDLEGTSGLTIAGWVKLGTGTQNWPVLLAKQNVPINSTTGQYNLQAGEFGDNKPALYINNGSFQRSVKANTALATSTWYHITATYDGTNSRIYINGIQDNSASSVTGNLAGNSNTVQIGTANTVFMNGAVDDVRIYNRALSASEVKQLYNLGKVLQKPPNNLGLVAYWSFNEGSGSTVADFSGNRNTGTTSNMANPPTSISGWTNGKLGKGMNFDGTDDFILTKDIDATDGASKMTLSLWMKARTDAAFMSYVSKCNGTSIPVSGWFLGTDVAGTGLAFLPACTGNELSSAPAGAHQLGVWEHWVIVFDGTQGVSNDRVKMYKNGNDVGATESGGTLPAALSTNGAVVTIGRHPLALGDPSFDGIMDEVRIYNRALSASEVAALYRSGAAVIGSSAGLTQGTTLGNSSLIGHWTFDGPDTNTTITDRSGNAKNGYFIGGATSTAKVQGKLGQALIFNGSNTYVETPTQSIAGTVAVSAWIYSSDLSQNGFIIGKNPVNTQWELFFEASFLKWRGNGTDNTVFCAAPTNNKWHHVVGMQTGTTGTLFIDGVQCITASLTAIGNGAGTIDIGRFDSGYYFNGKIDDVRLYNRLLTAEEVKQLYNLGKVILKQ